VLDELLPEAENEAAVEDLVELLEERAARPIFLPYARPETLAELPFLTPHQIEALIHLRDSLGTRMQWEDIQRLAAIDSITLRRLRPFVRLGRPPTRPRWFVRGMARVSLSASDQESYPQAPYRFYVRNLVQRRQWQGGLLYEKDAGELWMQPSGMPQYLSAHVGFTSNRWRAVAGDYQARWGQGLILWQGFALARGREVTQFFRYMPPLRPHTSVNEFAYFRGAAVRHRPNRRWEWMLLASYRRLDARLDSTGDTPRIISFDEGGYHRTPTQLLRQRNSGMSAFGGRVQWNGRLMQLAFHGLGLHLDRIFSPNDRPDRAALPQAQTWLYGSGAWKLTWRKTFFFGEAAVQYPLGWGGTAGLLTHISDITTGILVRHYDAAFYPMLGQPWGISTAYAPESGLYYALSGRYGRWTAAFYADIGRPVFLRYLQPRPFARYDWMVQLSQRHPSGRFYLYFRQKNIPLTESHEGQPASLVGLPLHVLRMDYRSTAAPFFQWHGRIETRWVGDSTAEAAFLILQDLSRRFPPAFRLTWRTAWAAHPTYHTRIYAYEPNVRYAFSFSQFTRTAIRTALLAGWKKGPWHIEAKAGYSFFPADDKPEEHRWDAAIQILWRL